MACLFYVRIDGEEIGPLSTQDICDSDLPDDVLVCEESIGEWLPAKEYNFMELLELEQMNTPAINKGFHLNEFGEVVMETETETEQDLEDAVNNNNNKKDDIFWTIVIWAAIISIIVVIFDYLARFALIFGNLLR